MRRPRLSYANVVASLALFVALGGTSYAVVKLPKGSVGSREVKDRSLRAVDLVPGVLPRQLRGPRGAEGPAGGAGARGPSDVITVNRNKVPFALAASYVDVLTLALPAGSWWLLGSASIVYSGPGSDFFRCSVQFGAASGGAGSVVRIGSDPGSTLAADLVIHEGRVLAGPTAVRLRCGHDLNLAGSDPRVDHAQLTAIRTDNLEIQPG